MPGTANLRPTVAGLGRERPLLIVILPGSACPKTPGASELRPRPWDITHPLDGNEPIRRGQW